MFRAPAALLPRNWQGRVEVKEVVYTAENPQTQSSSPWHTDLSCGTEHVFTRFHRRGSSVDHVSINILTAWWVARLCRILQAQSSRSETVLFFNIAVRMGKYMRFVTATEVCQGSYSRSSDFSAVLVECHQWVTVRNLCSKKKLLRNLRHVLTDAHTSVKM